MMFGNSSQLQGQIDALLERVGQLEEQMGRLASLVERQQQVAGELGARLDVLSADVASTETDTAVPAGGNAAEGHPQDEGVQPTHEQTLYFGPPHADGLMGEASATVREGESIYQLTTTDGTHGTFAVIPTSDSLATALISVSQFVKPVCRVVGTVSAQAARLETLREGAAELRDGAWVVTRKAEVRFV